MASIRTRSDFSNVLLVTGKELRHDSYRDDLRELLYAAGRSESAVRRGTHHFWITWFVPTTAGGEYDDGDLRARPRKLRGVIRMGRTPADTTADSMQKQLRTLLEEVGHHWLVPNDLDLGDGIRDRLATRNEWTAYLNDGAPLTGVPLLGRDNLHWNSYLQADKSPLDGQWWTEEQREGPLVRWTNRARDVATLTLPSFDPVTLSTAFSDLDLSIMGLMDPKAAYADSNNELRWIDPQLVAPLPYRAGLCVCESNTSVLLFGFDQDHRALCVARVTSRGTTTLATVRPTNFPARPAGLALRVVRRGSDYHFQARADSAVAAHLAPEPLDIPGGSAVAPRIRGAFDDLTTIPTAGTPTDLAAFRTIATVRSTDTPVALGAVVDRWAGSTYVQAGVYNLEIRQPRKTDITHVFTSVPPTMAAGSSYDAAGSEPRLHLPDRRAIIRRRGRNVLLIAAPYATRNTSNSYTNIDDFALSISNDHAPKVLVEGPTGDFTAVTSVAITRSATSPWAAGYLRDRQAWGHINRVPVARLKLGADSRTKKLTVGRTTTFSFAFIITAADDDDLDPERDLVSRIDLLRRYFELALPRASRGLLKARTNL